MNEGTCVSESRRNQSSATVLSQATLSRLPDDVARARYDRTALTPGIVHIGVGHFHRAHQALAIDRLLELGLARDWAICGAGIMSDAERMASIMREQDCLYTLVEKDNDGSTHARVIGSIIDYIDGVADPEALIERLANEQTRIVTLTITEGGYNFDQTTGEFLEDDSAICADLQPGASPVTVFGFVIEALARRRSRGIPGFTILSCDNIQHNGDVAARAFLRFAELMDSDLASWMRDHVSFPNSMVDRITPGTTEQDVVDVEMLIGMRDAWPVVSEPFFQWVVEDTFPYGRPPLEEVGVQMVADVEPYEEMKIRILNGGHQVLCYFGFLSGFTYVHEAAADPAVGALMAAYMRTEALPTLHPVADIDFNDYVASGVRRFQNPAIKDTLARICAFTSDRIPKFLLPVVRDQLRSGGRIELSAGAVASWARYAEGVDETGEPIEIVDQLADDLIPLARRQRHDPLAFLSNRAVFGDLVDDERFRAAYLAALESLLTQGARTTTRTLLAALPATS
jgi:mannitol 2-dehydrogenase